MGARWTALGLLVIPLAIPATSAGPSLAIPPLDSTCDIGGLEVLVDGRPAAVTDARAGDQLEVRFDVPSGCVNRITLASFVAPSPAFDGSRLDEQVPYQRSTDVFGPGRHSLAVSVYPFAPVDPGSCLAARARANAERAELAADVREEALADPVVLQRLRSALSQRSTAVVGPVEVSCLSASGDRPPCDGCVGNADDKDPPGQGPTGSDHDAGHECDRNQGIGNGNPAHEGCPNFQIDLAYRPAMQAVSDRSMHPSELVFGLFCVRTAGVCYLTDNSEGRQVAATIGRGMSSAAPVSR